VPFFSGLTPAIDHSPQNSKGDLPSRAARRKASRGRPLTPAIKLPNRALDVYEVADILDCCAATVRREVTRGRLHGTKVGSRWRFQPDDIAAYLDGETPASSAERTAWDAYVRKVVAAPPPLTPEQIAALSALFD
jgi:excisionase family DNA binding protein